MKKIILFIVEGPNDEREINAILHSKRFEQYLPFYKICFAVQGTDITLNGFFPHGKKKSDKKKKLEGMRAVVDNVVLDFRRGKYNSPEIYGSISLSDIHEVVQIVDLDGAFVNHDKVVQGPNATIRYEDESIIIRDVNYIRNRNNIKTENLQKLIKAKTAGGIPYSIYYVSCNMDHVLFDSRNPTDEEKRDAAERTATMGEAIEKLLAMSLFSNGIKAENSYEESWEEIQFEVNSLNRHTNFNLFFEDKARNPK